MRFVREVSTAIVRVRLYGLAEHRPAYVVRTVVNSSLRPRLLAPEMIILSSSAARSRHPPRPGDAHGGTLTAASTVTSPEKSGSTVRNVTGRLELGERMCPRVASGSQLGLSIQR